MELSFMKSINPRGKVFEERFLCVAAKFYKACQTFELGVDKSSSSSWTFVHFIPMWSFGCSESGILLYHEILTDSRENDVWIPR